MGAHGIVNVTDRGCHRSNLAAKSTDARRLYRRHRFPSGYGAYYLVGDAAAASTSPSDIAVSFSSAADSSSSDS